MRVSRHRARWKWIAALILAVLAAAIVVGLGWALNHGTLHAEAEARLSATLGQPVTIGIVRFALLPRAALGGSDIRIGDVREDASAVDLHRVHVPRRVCSLLIGQGVVEEVRLEGLTVSVLRDRAGRWHVPESPLRNALAAELWRPLHPGIKSRLFLPPPRE